MKLVRRRVHRRAFKVLLLPVVAALRGDTAQFMADRRGAVGA